MERNDLNIERISRLELELRKVGVEVKGLEEDNDDR
jgi:hypothetical protein